MITTQTLIDSPAFQSYVSQMKKDITAIIEQTYSLSRVFEIGEPELKRSLHLEASALACHWMQAFSEETPEMLIWSKLFSKHLVSKTEASAAYSNVGSPGDATRFFANRLAFYRSNNASWRLDERLLTSWIGIFNFCVLFRTIKVPPFIAPDQQAELLIQMTDVDANLESLQTTLGIDPRSQEYKNLMALWLNNFAEDLARIIRASNKAYIAAMVEYKNESTEAMKTMRAYQGICIALAAWCLILPFLEFEQTWIYQLTRFAVTIEAVFLAIIFRGWQFIFACIIAILFNPIVPIDFDKDAWKIVDTATAVYFIIVAFRPSPYIRKTQQDASSNH